MTRGVAVCRFRRERECLVAAGVRPSVTTGWAIVRQGPSRPAQEGFTANSVQHDRIAWSVRVEVWWRADQPQASRSIMCAALGLAEALRIRDIAGGRV